MKDFSKKVAVITGAGSGIGQALAVALAERGCIVALADVNQNGLQATRGQVVAAGATCSTHVVDVADREAVEAFAAEVFQEHGAVHLVINNAGVTLVDQAERVSYEDFNWIMNINFWGVVYGTKAFLPYLWQVDEAHIVNVSSLFGLVAMPAQSTYNASKFAVRGFTESLKMDLAGSSIGVSCVHPGGIKTSIGKHARVREDSISVSKEELLAEFEKRATTTPERAAAVIIRGIEKKRRRILIGFDARLFDWISRLFPGSYERIFGLEKYAHARNEARRESES
jgi:NAD(P)-dependent dehydrogenase (short-subunit alcohol dehydrogenase family)